MIALSANDDKIIQLLDLVEKGGKMHVKGGKTLYVKGRKFNLPM